MKQTIIVFIENEQHLIIAFAISNQFYMRSVHNVLHDIAINVILAAVAHLCCQVLMQATGYHKTNCKTLKPFQFSCYTPLDKQWERETPREISLFFTFSTVKSLSSQFTVDSGSHNRACSLYICDRRQCPFRDCSQWFNQCVLSRKCAATGQ